MAKVEETPADHLEWETPLYQQALTQFEQALEHAEVPANVAERLRYPERSLIVSVPVRLDDDTWRVFPGYRVQHSSVLGPTKGGVRYDREVSLGECAALAMWMTWKCALLRLPYGGAKGGVRCEPRQLSIGEYERVTRRFTSELLPIIGPQEDIPAPDMATNEQTMAWMMDTYSMQRGHVVPEIVTGKPVALGGSLFRHEATGAGVVMVVERACHRLGWELAGQRCVVQGFGNVGGIAAAELQDKGAIVVAVSDVSGGIHDENGLEIRSIQEWLTERGCALQDLPDFDHVTNAELLELPCDILVLAAREDQVTGENAERIQARLVAEGANGPTTIEGDEILARRGILVLPDVLTNAGGVTVSYFEWVQDLGRLFWTRNEIRAKLADKLLDAFDRVWDLSQEQSISLRTSALVAGIREVGAALTARGIYPYEMDRVRDAMVAAPATLEASASAQEAGQRLIAPKVRAALVVDDGLLLGVVTRKTLVREVVATGRDPAATPLGAIAEPPIFVLDADGSLDEAFAELEARDLERVPVVEGGRLVGVLSRSAVQRRLAEDEAPVEDPEGTAV